MVDLRVEPEGGPSAASTESNDGHTTRSPGQLSLYHSEKIGLAKAAMRAIVTMIATITHQRDAANDGSGSSSNGLSSGANGGIPFGLLTPFPQSRLWIDPVTQGPQFIADAGQCGVGRDERFP